MIFFQTTFSACKRFGKVPPVVFKRCLTQTSTLNKNRGNDELYENCAVQQDDEAFSDICSISAHSHSVLAIQPNMKNIPARCKITTADLQLQELCALVESIPGWTVADKCVHSLKRVSTGQVFGKGKLQELNELVKQASENISAVVLGIDSLNIFQLSALQDLWGLPVYDRYTLILEIFKRRATTSEAKLQVAMAELEYLKSKLYGLHKDSLEFQKDGLTLLGGMGETTLDNRRNLLKERMIKINKELEKVQNKRELVRENRKKHEIPVVAVVGYTNAGKTSLIKSLTGLTKMTPRNQLFATLDISYFTGLLPNRVKISYIDTIGFISDIPDAFFKAFSATLQDVSHADLLLHVSDASHFDMVAQDITVKKTLESLPSMSESLLSNMIHVYNKIDLLTEQEREKLKSEVDPNCLLTSVREGWGRQDLLLRVQEALMKSTGRITKKLRVPLQGPMLPWLHKETVVEEVIPDENNIDMYLMKVTMTQTALSKFEYLFKPKNKSKS